MYKREIQGREEYISDNAISKGITLIYDHPEWGKVVGDLVTNPFALEYGEELIAAEGWVYFVPPVPEPTPQTEPTMDEVLKALNRMQEAQVYALDDEAALEVIALFPAWADFIGQEVQAGWRTYYDNRLWKVLQAHTIQADWTPDNAPSLYVQVSVEEWPEWVRPISAETAYNEGDKVTFERQHYISAINGNTWSPAEYSAGWNLVNE